jgi:hypothetical protein
MAILLDESLEPELKGQAMKKLDSLVSTLLALIKAS